MDVVADNLANANTTRTAAGGPFRRRQVVFEPQTSGSDFGGVLAGLRSGSQAALAGVQVAAIREDTSAPRRVYNPGHPDAGPDGYLALPNISTVSEMVDMMSATRAYEANVSCVQAAKQMAIKALEIGR